MRSPKLLEVESSPAAPRGRRRLATLLKGTVALAVSVGAFAWALSGVNVGEVQRSLARTSGETIVLFLASLLAIHVARILRYWLLVHRLGPVTPRDVAAAVCVGIPATLFLPLRLGELVRPVMLSRAGVPLPGALASVVVERGTDALLNVALFFGLLSALPPDANVPPEVRAAAAAMLLVFGGGLAFLTVAFFARARVFGLVEAVLGKVAPGLSAKVVGLIRAFLDGLASLGSASNLLGFLVLTTAYWAINGVSCYLLARSYGIDIPALAGPFAVSCVVFAVTAPAGPAFAGTLEAGYRLGLAPFGVSANQAMVVAIFTHAAQLLMMASFAVVGLRIARPAVTRPEASGGMAGEVPEVPSGREAQP